MGGVPSAPLPVALPNDLDLDPGEKAELWSYDASPLGGAAGWRMAGTGTVSADGGKIVSDPGVGVQRFCGVCGLVCWINRQERQPNPDPRAPACGDPVHLATGLCSLSKTDLVLPGRLAVTIDRSYNPFDPFGKIATAQPALGLGWYLSVDVFLLPIGDLFRLILPGNFRLPLARQPDGTFQNTTHPFLSGAVLNTLAGGDHQLRFKDGTTWRFRPMLLGLEFLIEIADRNGNRVTIQRDSGGRIQRIVEPAGRALEVTYAGSLISHITDPIGRTVQYGYDSSPRLTTVTDPAGGVTRYTYDAAGRILSITDPRGIVVVRNEYSPGSGRTLRQVQADGGELRFLYALQGATVTGGRCFTPPPGILSTLLLSCAPTVESVETVAQGWTFTGGVVVATTVIDPRGHASTYRFTTDGLTREITDALGQTTRFERDARGQLLSTTDPLGRMTQFTYDANGNVTSITDPAGNVQTFTYEPTFNKVTSVTDPVGNLTTFEYDSAGNLTAITDPEQNRKPETERLKTRIVYNQAGQVVSLTDPLGNITQFQYNPQGDLTSSIDPLGHNETRNYDAVSRLVRQTDPLGAVTHDAYDALDRLTTIIDPLGGTTSVGYDAIGNLLALTDARGNTVTHEYDSMNRLSRRIEQLGNAETFTYDSDGNLVSTTDRKGQTATLVYDPLNRLGRAIYADGSVAEFQYDAAGRLVKADDTDDPHRPITLEYDPLDRLLTETTAMGTVSYQYDTLGRRTEMTVGGQAPVTYTYDTNSRLLSITQIPLPPVAIEYDALGRRTLLALPNGASTEYKYDSASRLTALIYRNALGPLGELTYQYDAAGRRIGVGGFYANTLLPHPILSAVHEAANRLVAFDSKMMTFDRQGNLASVADASGTTLFTWDARNRLTSLSGPGVSANFLYDPSGRRASKIINGTRLDYQYDRADIVRELGNGTLVNYLRSLAIDEILTRNQGEFYLADAIGSVVTTTDNAGMVATSYSYEPFGRTMQSGLPSANPFTFTGREEDATGLYYYRARYYDPQTGRFLQEDPRGFLESLNFYTYAASNPLRYADPTGMASLQTDMSTGTTTFDPRPEDPNGNIYTIFGITAIVFSESLPGADSPYESSCTAVDRRDCVNARNPPPENEGSARLEHISIRGINEAA